MIFKAYLEKIKNDISESDIESLNSLMNGFTAADIISLLRESVIQ